MTERNHPLEQPNSGPFLSGSPKITEMPVAVPGGRYTSSLVIVEKRFQSNSVFLVDDPTFASEMPAPTHWSVGWSDLMMTMFVLFFALYAYQAAHQEFLGKKKPELIGGDTTEALQMHTTSKATLPFAPIRPGMPLMTAGTIKKVERVTEDTIDSSSPSPVSSTKTKPDGNTEKKASAEKEAPISLHPETIAVMLEPRQDKSVPLAVPPVPLPDDDVLGPNPIIPKESLQSQKDTFQEVYKLSKGALESNNLEKFASIDIVPDKTMRIILTGDLLFNLGESDLSKNARDYLQKIAAAIRNTPYMINVVGHTDNIPMRSNKFKSNWELSVARASSVARYLIDEIQMDPNQFVVSGYSSYRPVAPNDSVENREKNRRVEIIMSKRLPDPLPATTENLK
jgi:chemotaxis protein MotB